MLAKVCKRRVIATLSATCLYTTFAFTSFAEEDFQDTGPRVKRQLERSFGTTPRHRAFSKDTVDIVSADKYGDTNIVESLREVPGLQVQTGGSLGSQATVRLRGTTDDQNLVLLDGVPINSSFDNAFNFADFVLSGIDNVQVLRGGQSGYYGSSAMGGVINMTSRKGTGPLSAEVFFEGGSFQTFKEGFAVQQGTDNVDYFLQYTRTDKGEDLGRDSYFNNTVSGRLDFHPSDTWNVTLTSRFINAEKDLPVDVTVTNLAPFSLGFVLDENRTVARDFFLNSALFEWQPSRVYRFSLQTAYQISDSDLDNLADTSGSFNPNVEFSRVNSDRLFLRANNHALLYPGVELEAGFEYVQDILDVQNSSTSLSAVTSVFDENRHDVAGILQLTVTYRDLQATAGGRFDRYDDFGNVLSPRVAAEYLFRDQQVTVRSSYSRGFRAPAFRELLTPTIGNSELDPEQVQSIDAGVSKDFLKGQATVEVTYFINFFEDLITIGPQAIFENTETARSQGLETQACFNFGKYASGCVAYTFTDTELEDSAGEESSIPLISKHNVASSLEISPTPPLKVRVAANYRGEQSTALIPGVSLLALGGETLGEETDPFVKVDLDASYDLPVSPGVLKSFALTLHAENLFDEDYTEFPGLPNPGVSVLGGFRASFL